MFLAVWEFFILAKFSKHLILFCYFLTWLASPQWVTVTGNRMWSPCVFQWWQVDKVSPIKLFDENKTLSGLNLRHLLYQQNGAPYAKRIMESVFDLWKEGKIKPVVDSTWALEDVSCSQIIYCFITPFVLPDLAQETFLCSLLHAVWPLSL